MEDGWRMFSYFHCFIHPALHLSINILRKISPLVDFNIILAFLRVFQAETVEIRACQVGVFTRSIHVRKIHLSCKLYDRDKFGKNPE